MGTPRLSRRRALGLAAGAGVGAFLGGCAGPAPIPAPRPGRATEVRRLPGTGMQMALTVDDGADGDALAGYVGLVGTTGMPITFCPTHLFADNWLDQRRALRRLIDRGLVQIVNHTWSHRVLTTLSDAEVRAEIERNDDWIQKTFGITSRPYLRPPTGRWDRRVGAICGDLGFTRILLWDASFEDATPRAAQSMLAKADRALFPGAIVLAHANASSVAPHVGEVWRMIGRRRLLPVTIDQALGTSRSGG